MKWSKKYGKPAPQPNDLQRAARLIAALEQHGELSRAELIDCLHTTSSVLDMALKFARPRVVTIGRGQTTSYALRDRLPFAEIEPPRTMSGDEMKWITGR